MNHLKYPIGEFQVPSVISSDQRQILINDVKIFPETFREIAMSLSLKELKTAYRPEGLTARQVIHHVFDSHLHTYCRFKWALTEQDPIVKPYFEDLWAELPDNELIPITLSLQMIDTLHQRWVILMESMVMDDWNKTYTDPKYQITLKLDQSLALYAWHGKHHIGHVKIIRGY